MGSGYYDGFAFQWYELALQGTCVLPDVSIEESLVKYSGINSNAVLKSYSNGLFNSVPGYVEKLGTALRPLTPIPNAVGIGALVLSIIMDIVIKSTQPTSPDSYDLLRRVFGEEKASSVRSTMTEYLKRHGMFINDNQRLLEEIRRLEQQLSGRLTDLSQSLLLDGQMSTRGFKIWVNGASFHVQMLIHEARLEIQAGKPASDFHYRINTAIDVYLQNLDTLLDKYKTYKTSTTSLTQGGTCYGVGPCYWTCTLQNTETKCQAFQVTTGLCEHPEVTKAYVNRVFSSYEPILNLKNHFSNMKNNVYTLIHQHDTFIPPSQ